MHITQLGATLPMSLLHNYGWGLLKSSGSESNLRSFSWKPVTIGYMCPGPGGLQGWHLVIQGQEEPAWVSESTLYHWYKEVHPY